MPVDILLVNPLLLTQDPIEERLMTPYFPLGLLYLAATLRQAGYKVALWDGMFRKSTQEFVSALKEHRPRVVGISALSTVRAAALELARLAHDHGAIVLMGGADPTARPKSYLEYQVNGEHLVDIVVVGEGEETILELMPVFLGRATAPPLDQILGLAYRDDAGRPVHTSPRPLHKAIDEIPWPARDMLDMEAYRRAWHAKHGFFSLSVIASRGCPYECAWCQKGVFGRSFRPRAPERVAEEMRHIKERYHPDQVRIVDDVLGIDRRWVKRWRDAMLAQDAVIPFECLSRVDLVDREMLTWLKEAGCVRINFGAESGSQKVLDAMHKGTTVEQIREAARLCHDLGIEVYFYIMVGYPGEEWQDIQATVRLLRDTAPDSFSSTIAYPLPGTPFYDQVRDRLISQPDWHYTAENRLLYRGRYSTRFYRWVQRLLYREWQLGRVRQGLVRPSWKQALRMVAGLALARFMVYVLRYAPIDARAVSDEQPAATS